MNQEPPPLPTKKSPILWIALGVAIIGILTVVGLLKLTERWQQVKQTRSNLKTFQNENVGKLRKGLENEDSVAASSEILDSAQKKIGELAKAMPLGEKEIMLAGQDTLAELLPPLKKYLAAYDALLANNSYDAKGLATLADLEARKKLVENFASANQELTIAFAISGEQFAKSMQARGVTPALAEVAKREYIRSSNASLVAQIREGDRQLGQVMMEILDLYQSTWGKWKLEEDGQLVFEDEAAITKYNEMTERIQKIAAHQSEVQQKMLAEQEKAAGKK